MIIKTNDNMNFIRNYLNHLLIIITKYKPKVFSSWGKIFII